MSAIRLLRQSRPRFWLYLAGPVVVGLAYGAASIEELFSPIALVLVAYFLLPANSYLYGINDIFDAVIDRRNPKKATRELRYEGRRAVPIVVAIAGALGAGLVIVAPPPARWYLVGFLVLGAAYSAPPLRLKTRPPLDSISNGLYILPGCAAYAALAGSHPPVLAVLGGWLWTMGMHTFSAIPDIAPDRQGGIETMATLLGRRGALAYCAGCWSLAAVVFAVIDPLAGGALLVYPALIGVIQGADIGIARAYWLFPPLNGLVGMGLTFGGLWGVVYA